MFLQCRRLQFRATPPSLALSYFCCGLPLGYMNYTGFILDLELGQ